VLVAIHQPEYLGWLGFYGKMLRADYFVLLDTVQFIKRGFLHRNRIRTARGGQWLTIPVRTRGRFTQAIAATDIDPTAHWRRTHVKTIEYHYRRAPYFDDVWPRLRPLYDCSPSRLTAFTVPIIEAVREMLDITTPMVRAGELKASGHSTELLVNLTRAAGGDAYLSGEGGRRYMDAALLDRRGIRLAWTDFTHPIYRQLHSPFEPAMACIDLLFNEGPQRAARLLREAAGPPR